MSTRIQLRRDIAADWTAANPVLAQGEVGLELDTTKLKIGNGVDAWNSLDYALNDVTTQYSLTGGAGTAVSLVNDTATPGASKVYGTDSSGIRGWQVPSGGGAVSSVAGRIGAVTLTADDTPDGTTNKAYTATDKTKLANVEAAAQVNFISTSPLGVGSKLWAGSYQDAAAGIQNAVAFLHGSFFRAYHVDQTVIATSIDVALPAAVDAGLTNVTKRAILLHDASRPGLACPVAGTTYTDGLDDDCLKIDLPTNTAVRLDPSTGRTGLSTGARAIVSVVDNLTKSTDPYYCWSLGSFEINVTTFRSFVTSSLVSASISGWTGTLTSAQWKKCIIIPGWNSGSNSPRNLGPPIAWLPDLANVVVHMACPSSAAGSIFRFQVICFEGSAWKVHHAYGLTSSSTADLGEFPLRDTPPLGDFQVTNIAAASLTGGAGGSGYSAGTLTPSGSFTGTVPTFTVTVSSGAITGVTAIPVAGDFTVAPNGPLAMGGGTGGTLNVGFAPVFAPQGSSSAVTTDWTHATIISAGWRGTHFGTVAQVPANAAPIWVPGYGGVPGTSEGAGLNAVRYVFSTQHGNAYEAGYAYVLEDVNASGTASRRMKVTRFDTTDGGANPADIDITTAALSSTSDAIVIGRSTTTSANPSGLGYNQVGTCGWLLVSATSLRIVREVADAGTFAGRAEVIMLPRREIV